MPDALQADVKMNGINILIAYPDFPEPDTNAGGLRLWEIVKLLCRAGYRITFLAEHANHPKYRTVLQEEGVECVSDPEVYGGTDDSRLVQFLQQRKFVIAIFVHYHIYNRYAPFFRAFLPGCKLILDTVDLHFLRTAREAAVTASAELLQYADQVKRDEFAAIADADAVWVVTADEQDRLFREPNLLCRPVDIIPTIHEVDAAPPGQATRIGVLFIGDYRHSPNVDAANYFLADILPELRRLLPDIPVTLAGCNPPQSLQQSGRALGVAVPGYVEDHRALLRGHRVGIAPLRFGAGIKGKIGEYLSCGLPCVTSPIGAEGMDLIDEKEILVADSPASFAHSIARLYQDIPLWERLSRHGRQAIEDRLSSLAVGAQLVAALQKTLARPASRPTLGSWLHALPLNPIACLSLARKACGRLREGGFGGLLAAWKVWSTGSRRKADMRIHSRPTANLNRAIADDSTPTNTQRGGES